MDFNTLFKNYPWNKGLTKETDKRVAEYGKRGSLARIGMVAWNKGKKLRGNCFICGKEFQITNKYGQRRKTCSPECTGKSISLTLKRKGIKPPSQMGKKWGVDYPIENHNWWKGGISPVRSRIWNSGEFQSWRKEIFERDDYTCKVCGKRGGKLNVDHFPITFSEILEMRSIKSLEEAIMCDELWNIDNGRTLCVDCHRLTPTYGVNNRFRKDTLWQTQIG